jgi:hypothetical protein
MSRPSRDNNDAVPAARLTTNRERYNPDVTKRAKPLQSRLVTRDSDIRRVLLADLSQLYSDKDHDLIVEEFGCNSARTDIAVINGALHAFEIKSDSDSLDRLPSQIEAYQGVFEYITLICGRRLLKRARVTIPKWWGLQKAEHKDGCVVLQELRAPKLNPRQDALCLAKMLWKKEALACLRKHGHKVVTSKHSADEVSQAVADNIPVSVLTDEVRQAIKIRGGSGFARRSALNGDSYSIESTVPVNHSPDLSWLLAEQYRNHLD